MDSPISQVSVRGCRARSSGLYRGGDDFVDSLISQVSVRGCRARSSGLYRGGDTTNNRVHLVVVTSLIHQYLR